VLILNRARVVAEGTVGEIVRRAAAPRRARLRVPPEEVERALATLTGSGVQDVAPAGGAAGWLTAQLARVPRARPTRR
jgi:ABC-2 type transport system ATP-binding protein